MLKSDYANELMLAKMRNHNWRVENERIRQRYAVLQQERDTFRKLALKGLWLLPIGYFVGFILTKIVYGL